MSKSSLYIARLALHEIYAKQLSGRPIYVAIILAIRPPTKCPSCQKRILIQSCQDNYRKKKYGFVNGTEEGRVARCTNLRELGLLLNLYCVESWQVSD